MEAAKLRLSFGVGVFISIISLPEFWLPAYRAGGGVLSCLYHLPPDIRRASDETIVEDMRRVARLRRGSHLRYVTYMEHGRFCGTTVVHRFGSWNKALERAGLAVGKRVDIPTEELFRQMEFMWRKLGRRPVYTDYEGMPGMPCSSTYAHRFGSWRKALEAFVEWANRRGKGEKAGMEEAVKVGIRKRRTARKADLRLRYRVLRRDGFKCVQCGRSPANEAGVRLHVDHVLAWAKGGETVYENLQTLCERCNLGKATLAARE